MTDSKPPFKGWQCPVCEHGVSPTVDVCPCTESTDKQVHKCPTCQQFYKGNVHTCFQWQPVPNTITVTNPHRNPPPYTTTYSQQPLF